MVGIYFIRNTPCYSFEAPIIFPIIYVMQKLQLLQSLLYNITNELNICHQKSQQKRRKPSSVAVTSLDTWPSWWRTSKRARAVVATSRTRKKKLSSQASRNPKARARPDPVTTQRNCRHLGHLELMLFCLFIFIPWSNWRTSERWRETFGVSVEWKKCLATEVEQVGLCERWQVCELVGC